MSSTQGMVVTIVFLMAAVLSTGAALQDHFVGDLWLAATIQETTAAPWEAAMKVVTFIGRAPVLIAISLPLTVWLLWKRQSVEAFAVAAALLCFGTTPVLKILVGRPRPTDDLVTVWRNHQGLSRIHRRTPMDGVRTAEGGG